MAGASPRSPVPVHWDDRYCGGAWVLSSYDEVAAALRDPRLACARAGSWVNACGSGARDEFKDLKRLMARTMLFADGSRHKRLRLAVAPAFAGERLAALQDEVLEAIDLRLDALGAAGAAGDAVDFMALVARPLPVAVIARLLGLAPAEADALVEASDAIARFIGTPDPGMDEAREAQRGAIALRDAFVAHLARARALASGDACAGAAGLAAAPAAASAGLLDEMMRAHAVGRLRAGELLSQCAMLLFAGHETTRNLLGNALRAFSAAPSLWARLGEGRLDLRAALHEVLRLESPVRYTGRRARTELVIGGCRVRRGDLVIARLDLANRDPAVYTAPGEFHPDRAEAPPLSFGWGPHRCLGAELSLLEAGLALARCAQRLPRLEVLPGATEWLDNDVYFGPGRLAVRTGALRPGAGLAPPLPRRRAGREAHA